MHLKVPVRFGGGPMEKDRTKRATPRPRPTQYKNAQWLSAAGVVELGLSDIEERRDPTGKLPFDKKLPGYWLARIAGAEERWACTPTVAWASERGQTVAITQASVWTAHSRAMETWYERLRTARTALYADPTPAGALVFSDN